ncbi:MAG TPA: type II toxin-antitoxin system VapC family toxin [Acidobacteriota bacterium]
MSELLLDSDVIIWWLRGESPYDSLIPALLQRDSLFWTPISVAELFAGARTSEEPELEKLFLILDVLAITAEIGRYAGYYMRRFSKSHGVELADALIAATAHSHNFPLWTLNRRHYPMKDIRFFSPPGRRL